jgi:D-serine dehydratase
MSRWFRNLPDGLGPAEVLGLHVSELQLPNLTLRASALENNLELLSRWCAEHTISHAPHAKTHMSPELTQLQLARGAWAMTAATAAQARLLRQFGAPRVLLANQVADRAALRWLRDCIADTDAEFTVMPLVDSVDLVAHMDAELAPGSGGRRLPVLVELGLADKRTGARSAGQALEVAAAVHGSRALSLVGVECYEGVVGLPRDATALSAVDAFLGQLADLAVRIDRAGMFDGTAEIILTAGGSIFFDRLAPVAAALPALSRPVRAVVRAGGYLAHDCGAYGESSPLSAVARHPLGALRPALELWAVVQSVPEPGLALAGFGKRDASFDIELPVVLGVRRGDEPERAPAGLRVERLNDQHAFVAGGSWLKVGDILRLGVTHSCTSFDKWPLIPVLDDSDKVAGTVTTLF